MEAPNLGPGWIWYLLFIIMGAIGIIASIVWVIKGIIWLFHHIQIN